VVSTGELMVNILAGLLAQNTVAVHLLVANSYSLLGYYSVDCTAAGNQ
jgi:hypothetical protein